MKVMNATAENPTKAGVFVSLYLTQLHPFTQKVSVNKTIKGGQNGNN